MANMWITLSPIFKFRAMNQLQRDWMLKMSMLTTILALLPSCIHLMLKPSNTRFRFCLLTSSLSFFIFSFQVHEKAILLPTLAVLILLPELGVFGVSFMAIACYSLYQLMEKDNICLSALFLSITWLCVAVGAVNSISSYGLTTGGPLHPIIETSRFVIHQRQGKPLNDVIQDFGTFLLHFTIMGICCALAIRVAITPPVRYPYIHEYIMAASSCAFLFLVLVVCTIAQPFVAIGTTSKRV